MKKFCVRLSVVGALLITLPILWQIHGGSTIYNPLSYYLWPSLSLVTMIVLLRAKEGGWKLMGGYILSDLSVAIYGQIKIGKVTFGWFEAFIVSLVVACIVTWLLCEKRETKGGDKLKPSVIMNASALMIAGIPQIVDAYRRPEEISYPIALGYIGISVASYLGEDKFNGRLIPVLSVIYWLIALIPVTLVRLS